MNRATISFATADRVVLSLMIVFVVLFGGSARPEIAGTMFVRACAVLAIGYALLPRSDTRDFRPVFPFWLLLALMAVMLLQLIPLPPSLWAAIPGRDTIVGAERVIGLEGNWRPISLAPDLTINALFACLPPLAMFLLAARVDGEGHRQAMLILLAVVFASGVFGLMQLAGGSTSPLYLYRITNRESAVGFFANRNHQAILLACMLPALAAMGRVYGSTTRQRRTLTLIGAAAILFILPLIFVTGSRTGLIVAFFAMLASALLIDLHHITPLARSAKLGRVGVLALIGAALAILAVITILSSRDVAFERLFATNFYEEQRITLFQPLVAIIARYFPFGSGFGTFEHVFKIHEPFQNLNPKYFNHAHNDLLEVLIEGGVFSLALIVLIVVWLAKSVVAIFRNTLVSSPSVFQARVGVVMIGLVLMSSLADYPLRTPAIATLMALFCHWSVYRSRQASRQSMDAGDVILFERDQKRRGQVSLQP